MKTITSFILITLMTIPAVKAQTNTNPERTGCWCTGRIQRKSGSDGVSCQGAWYNLTDR